MSAGLNLEQAAGEPETAAVGKAATGIEGFDDITRGGLPAGRTTLVMGGPGAGKTVFALQSLVNGARLGEPGIFVAFEENSRRIVANAATFGWDLPGLEHEKLFFLDARVSPGLTMAGDFDLSGMLAAIEVKATEMQAKRIVFDGIDVLLALLDDPVAERREIHRLHDWLSERDLTAIFTAKAEERDPLSVQRYGFLQFMVDCVVVLHHRLSERVSLRGIRVLKYRGSGFSANEFPFVISSEGLEVFTYGEPASAHVEDIGDERVTSGVARLDAMLGGGYYRGSAVLITGAPGTAKTTLGAAFAAAACERGERCLFVSFDEPAGQLLRNLNSVNIRLAPYVEAGLLDVHHVRTESMSAEAHLIRLRAVMREREPRCMVIDPLSALAKSGGRIAAVDASLRLVDYAKARGMTVVYTSLVADGEEALSEATATQVSTVADTWLHLSYVVLAGERNRALTIVKSRGTAHSNQVRELVLGGDGVTLTDVYTAGGAVLMGTARWEKEFEERAERARQRVESERQRRELERLEMETGTRIEMLRRELEGRRAELQVLEAERELREQRWRDAMTRRLELRGADAGDAAGLD